MDRKEVLSKADHTILAVDCVWEQVKQVADDGMHYATASVCIPPAYVKQAKDYVGDKLKICTVIGFPNGYNTTAVKVFETKDAIVNGADEIDMVINVGALKAGRNDYVENEIREIKAACGDRILKVIVEECLLTPEEIATVSKLVSSAGADFIKTSTGFNKGGATVEGVQIMLDNIFNGVKVKAAGGIATIADAEKFLKMGCERLGTSRVVKITKAEEQNS